MKRLKLYEEFVANPKVLPSEPEIKPGTKPERPVAPEEPEYLPEEPDEYQIVRPEEDPDPQARKNKESKLINKVIKKYKDLKNNA
jgi:hypothetical protein